MSKKHAFIKYLLVLTVVLFTVNAFSEKKPAKPAKAAKAPAVKVYKDVIVVIDTSKSMRGVGPTAKKLGMGDLSSKVKESAAKFVDDLNTGDTFTLVTFSTRTKFYKTVKISSVIDKDKIKSNINSIKFEGNDTFTSRMIRNVEKKVTQIEKSLKNAANRNTMVVIMSDGLDDPPSVARRSKLKLKEYGKATRPSGSPMYIYYLHLSPKSVTKEQQKRIEVLRGGRGGRTTVTQADPSGGNQKVIERAVDKTKKNYKDDTTKKAEAKKADSGFMGFIKANWWWLLLVLLVVIAGIVLAIMMFSGGKKKPKRYMIGHLIYGDKKSNHQESNKLNLASVKKGYIKIGTTKMDDITLRGISFPGISIYGNKQGGKDGFDISEEDLKKINIIQQKKDGVLSYDDIFEIESFEFTIKLKP